MAHLLLVCCALVQEPRSGGDGCFRNSPDYAEDRLKQPADKRASARGRSGWYSCGAANSCS